MAEHLPTDVSPAFAAQLRDALRRARSIYDSQTHVHWTVYELPPGPYDRRATPTLVFEDEGSSMHRVRDYPDDWRELSNEVLLGLRRRR